ncbi:Putative WRKY DNA-binding domain superfamily protein [Zea mays]|uniref:Putative WRKY DNA-binding domain superfamily protein n=1 Tax=Zea mays TaxID=4577 RepID=A0A1D6G950_MAIZE|nr:Putative WRKY DNA-binding domain superfamily protein [Zea mays]
MTLDTPAAVVLELMTMGQQSAAHLGDLLRAASPAAASPHQELAAEILRCCGRVIDALRAAAAASGHKRKAAAEYQDAAAGGGASPPPPPPPPGPPLKRRARGGEATREVTSGTTVDGFIWRKLYYRCAHKDQGCDATRRVQRTREQPAAYEIAYYGDHTCRGAATAWQQGAPAPAVVDFGSNSWGSADTTSGGSPASVPLGGWWSPSASSEVGFEAHAAAHEWRDTAAAAPDPVMEFLDGAFGWESVLEDRFDLGGLHGIATFQ